MSDGYPDRSKQRRNDGIIGAVASTAKNVQSFADSTKEQLAAAQTGTLGKFTFSTNLIDMLGQSLYGGIAGKQPMGDIGKSAMEQSLFGMKFDINPSSSIDFKTSPIEGPKGTGRDYRLTFTKKF